MRYFHLLSSKPFYAKTKDKMLAVPEITKCNAIKKMLLWPSHQGRLSGCGIGMHIFLAKIYCSMVQIRYNSVIIVFRL